MLKLFFVLLLFIIFQLKPAIGLAFDTSDPSVSLLQNRISNNFSKKYCNAIQNGLSKDEAMKSAIVKLKTLYLSLTILRKNGLRKVTWQIKFHCK